MMGGVAGAPARVPPELHSLPLPRFRSLGKVVCNEVKRDKYMIIISGSSQSVETLKDA